MIKKILLLVVLLLNLNIEAQDKNKLEKLHLNLGITLSDYTFKSDQGELAYNSQMGFRLGVDYDLLTKKAFNLETGLTLSYLGTGIDQPKIEYSTYYLGTHFVANYAVLKDKIFVGAGPFIDVALSATQTIGGKEIDPLEGQNGNDPPLSRLNYGVDFKVLGNLPLNFPLQAYVSYRLGLANIEGADSESGQEFKASVISFGIRTSLQSIFGK